MEYQVRPLQTVSFDSRSLVLYTTVSKDVPLQVNWSERSCALPKTFASILEDILNLNVRCEDVFVVTFMKSGTTWMQEAVWLLLNDLDFHAAKQKLISRRSYFIDGPGFYKMLFNSMTECINAKNPRLIKTHLPANLLPMELWQKKPKIIYVARNVKDVVVSSYHFLKDMSVWHSTLDEFVQAFMRDAVVYTSYWSHILDFWHLRNEPYVFFVTYEQMKSDFANVLQKLCIFLEKPQLNSEQLQKMLQHLSFDEMKNNEQTNLTAAIKMLPNVQEQFQFMRRGIVGSYKDELTLEQQQQLDNWSNSILKEFGISEVDIFGTF